MYSGKVTRIRTAREELEKDLEEVYEDVDHSVKATERTKKRIVEIEQFLAQASLRIPAIQEELANLDPEDHDRGWAEAFWHEYESLTHQEVMAKEELRLLKANLIRRKEETLSLLLEVEETEVELDRVAVLEMEACEGLRRAEVGRIERKVNDQRNRALRQERMKWKIESNRVNVIRRNRKGYQDIIANVSPIASPWPLPLPSLTPVF